MFFIIIIIIILTDNIIEYSWVMLHCLVCSHDSKQVLNCQYLNISCVTETVETQVKSSNLNDLLSACK